jgi:hypothetical protein
MATIYRKTAKAQEEIDTRAHRLVPRLRTALILVDGRRTDDELRKMIMLQADETLAALLAQGFIEVAGEAEAVPARPAAAPVAAAVRTPAAAVAVPAGKAFEQRRREAVRAFTDLVGPMGELLAIKMEKARSADELRPLLEMARQIIANSRGGSAAAQFAERHVGATVPA